MTNGKGKDEQSDLFISYSHDDSRDVVKGLVGELEAMGLDVWYDDIEMSLGDSIRKSIDKGLRTSNFGVVVLSEGYFEGTSEWELNGLVKKHTQESNVLLPLWHEVGHDYIYEQSASLADLKAESITQENIQSVASSIYNVVEKDSKDVSGWGVDNRDDSGEGSSFEDVDIRYQGNVNLDAGTKITIKSWRNHNPPDFSQLEAVEICDGERGIDYPSDSTGTVMTVATIEEPLKGVVSDIDNIRSGKMEFTIRVKQSRMDELSDDPDDYISGFV